MFRVLLTLITTLLITSADNGSLLETFLTDMLKSMDSLADPCEDFHRYSCGGWEDENCPNDGAHIDAPKLTLDFFNVMKEFLENLKSNNDLTESEKILVANYDNCIKAASRTRDDTERLVQKLRSSIKNLNIAVIPGESKALRILRFEAALRREFGVDGSFTRVATFVPVKPNMSGAVSMSIDVPTNVSHNPAESISFPQAKATEIWTAYIGELLQINDRQKVQNLLSNYTIQVAGSLSSFEALELVDEMNMRQWIVDIVEKRLLEQEPSSPHKICLKYAEKHSAGAVLKSFSIRYLKQNVTELKADLELFVNIIFAAFPILMSTNQWIPAGEQVALINHIDDTRFHLSLPDWSLSEEGVLAHTARFNSSRTYLENDRHACQTFQTDAIQRSICLLDIMFLNQLGYKAFYVGVSNGIYLSLGALLEPTFVAGKAFQTVRFSRLGFTIGHELMHGANRYLEERSAILGGQFNERNNIVNECVTDIYDIAEKEHNLTKHAPSLTEDIPDIEGTRLSYLAYSFHKLLHEQPPKSPLVSNFTDDQLFFISHANIFCTCAKVSLSSDHHSLNRLRAEIPVWEMAQFGKAFGCKPNSTYSKRKRCEVYSNLKIIDV